MELPRRDALRVLATSAAALAGAATVGGISAGVARAADLGTLIDYSAGVPAASAVRDAGYKGVVRYCSEPRAAWMHGKPLTRGEAEDMRSAGLQIVSCYQYGKGEGSDWKGGYDAGVRHATSGLRLHRAAGGPDSAPVYMSIDSDPTPGEINDHVLPFLRGCESVLGHARTGVYCNAPTIDRALAAGLGNFYWQHDWGSAGRVHDAAHLHQRSDPNSKSRSVDGVSIDLNTILKPGYGQWSAAEGRRGGSGTLSKDAPGGQARDPVAHVSDSAGDPSALPDETVHIVERVTGLAGRAADIAARLAGRLG